MLQKVAILLLCCSSLLTAKASHLLGGEITYKYISGNTYQIFVTLYRDCNDCKLGGDGGGNSTDNCTDLSNAYIRTISSACQNKDIGTIPLSKTGFTNITKICDQTQSKCGSSGTYNFGVEAHTYTGTVDFNNYSTYSNCGFHIYIYKSERSDDITTLQSEKIDLYNYAYINPWLENKSSPKFETDPSVIFEVNNTYRGGDYVSSNNDDSIAYKLASPMHAHLLPMHYKSGFSAHQFLTTYCPFGCTPDPTTTPPTGIYLNAETGDMIFTPTNLGEIGTRVSEVEQWRKNGSAWYLAGVVRRDVASIVASSTANYSPKILAEESYDLCVDQLFKLTINASDQKYYTSSPNDSVNLSIDNVFTGLSVMQNDKITAPYQSLAISYTPTIADIGVKYIRVYARDNSCPVYGESYKTIRLNIVPKPITTWDIEEVYCGYNTVDINSNRTLAVGFWAASGIDTLYKNPLVTSNISFQTQENGDIDYTLVSNDNYGCRDTFRRTVTNKGANSVERARIIGGLTLCEGDNLDVHLRHSSDSISLVTWQLPSQGPIQTATLNSTIENGNLHFAYTLEKNNIHCDITDSVNLQVLKRPVIKLDVKSTYCANSTLIYADLDATPSNGDWLVDSTLLTQDVPIRNFVDNENTTMELSYRVTDQTTLCTNNKAQILTIIKSPEIGLESQSVCGTGDQYELSNTIDNIDINATSTNLWSVTNKPLSIIHAPTPLLDLPNSGYGKYNIICTRTSNNGCTTKDSTQVIVNEILQLAYNSKDILCQSSEILNLNDYFEMNITGGTWEGSADLSIDGSTSKPSHCGNYNLKYSYTKNDCSSEVQFPISVVCKPPFEATIPKTICQDAAPIDLNVSYQWIGDGVTDGMLDVSSLGNNSSLTMRKTISGCVFDSTVNLTILEPNYINVYGVPDQLCEGEVMNLEFGRSPICKITYESCDQTGVIEHGVFGYSPSKCDLNNGDIKIDITSTLDAHCPDAIVTVDVPYFKKPNGEISQIYDGCEPFTQDIQFEVTPSTAQINYALSGGNKFLSGESNTIRAKDFEFGTYIVELDLTSKKGCKNKVVIEDKIRVYAKPTADFNMSNEEKLTLSDRVIYLNNYSGIEEGAFASSWYYNIDGPLVQFSTDNNVNYELPPDTGNVDILLVAESSKGCTDTAMSKVILVPDVIAFIPSAFTPNGKEPNNKFTVVSDHAQSYHIDIFNKWGQKVFAGNSIEESWDGTYLGKYCQIGVYLYSIKLINKTDDEFTFQGTVNLIR